MSTVASPFPLKPTLLNLLHESRNLNTFNQIHSLILTSGISRDLSVLVKIADFLAANTNPYIGYRTLKKIHHHPTPFLFNSLILGYAGSKTPRSGLVVYKHMTGDGIPPDKYTFPAILKSCAKFSGIGEARQVYAASVKMGYSSDIYVQNSVIHIYCSCGELVDAGKLLDEMPLKDVVSWTGLISGLVKAGFFGRALGLFASMDVEPNGATLVSVLVACGRLGDLAVGKRVHGLVLKCGTGVNILSGNALLDMYVKCGRLDEARQVFGELVERDVVSWTSIINGLVQCKHPKDAIDVFHAMQASGVAPDKVVLSSVLSACASLGALDSGRWVHEHIGHKGIEWDVHIGTALVDMYAKCGNLELAVDTFQKMPNKNISSWNALLGGLAMHGHGNDTLNYFNRMVEIGIAPNEVTFIAILSACSHSGLVDEGRCQFSSMAKDYNLTPWIQHYGCMVDLLGRAGLLEEANELIRTMPMRADVLIWGAMLSACKAHGNTELTQQILGHLLDLEPCDSGVYVLLSNIYAKNNRWGDVTRMRRLMREKGIKKDPGSSVIEVNGKAHEFLVGEKAHPQREEIWLVLCILAKQVQHDGQLC